VLAKSLQTILGNTQNEVISYEKNEESPRKRTATDSLNLGSINAKICDGGKFSRSKIRYKK